MSTRLQQPNLRDAFTALYKKSNSALKSTPVPGIFSGFRDFGLGSGCAICRGVPAAVLPNPDPTHDALLFDVEQYRKLWGDQSPCGIVGSRPEKWYASVEQVREAIARGADVETEDKETS
jgi:hypothetical protein